MRARDAQRVATRLRKDGFPARVVSDEESHKVKWVFFESGPWMVHVMRRTHRGVLRVIVDHDDLEVVVFEVRCAGEVSGAVRVAMVLGT